MPMMDDRVWENVTIRVEHGQSDDEFRAGNVSLSDAIELAKSRIVETWNEYAEEDAVSGGFPYYGVTIEMEMEPAQSLECRSLSFSWQNGEIVGQWSVDSGIVYELTQ